MHQKKKPLHSELNLELHELELAGFENKTVSFSILRQRTTKVTNQIQTGLYDPLFKSLKVYKLLCLIDMVDASHLKNLRACHKDFPC